MTTKYYIIDDSSYLYNRIFKVELGQNTALVYEYQTLLNLDTLTIKRKWKRFRWNTLPPNCREMSEQEVFLELL